MNYRTLSPRRITQIVDDAFSYDPDAECPKCKGEDVGTRYEEGHDCDRGATCSYPEHFVRHCRRCSYEWLERSRP